ncbi:hypothetical protein AB6896_01815 [Rahnella inusitata]|uniref:hypothetical protein n=1 Tax=Rahnella inusitata TaxID=58169 RepID=UPI0039BE6474
MSNMQLVVTDSNDSCFEDDFIYAIHQNEDGTCWVRDDEDNSHQVEDLIRDGVSFVVEPDTE